MEFISDEAEDDSFDLQFSDLEKELADDDIITFIDDSQQPQESISVFIDKETPKI